MSQRSEAAQHHETTCKGARRTAYAATRPTLVQRDKLDNVRVRLTETTST